MERSGSTEGMEAVSFHETILRQGGLISDELSMLRMEHYPPNATKGLRPFTLAEVAYFLGVTPSNIKKLHHQTSCLPILIQLTAQHHPHDSSTKRFKQPIREDEYTSDGSRRLDLVPIQGP